MMNQTHKTSITGWGESRFREDYEKYKDTFWKYGVPQEVLLVDWKSEKCRDFSVPHPSKITPPMVTCLQRLLDGNKTGLNPRTIKALQWRKLCDDQAELTEHGRVIAMQGLPLKTQCALLNVPLDIWEVPSISDPEMTVVKILNRSGKKAYFSENSFTNAINFFLLGELIPLAKKHNKTLYTIEVTQYPELFYLIKDELPEVLQRIDEHTCKNNFDLFYEYFRHSFFIEGPVRGLDFCREVFNSFGINTIRSLIEMYLSDPLAYSWRGWPDIVVTQETIPYFVEVKTTDSFHLNQLVTIPDLMTWTNIPVKCIQLTRQQVGNA